MVSVCHHICLFKSVRIFCQMKRDCFTISAEFIVDCIDEVIDTFFLEDFVESTVYMNYEKYF